jgi:hypothetical protein
MANRSIFWRTTLAVLLLTVTSNLPAARAAIRTDRLSPRQARVWNSIREIVFAENSSNQLLHPGLHGLLQSMESSNHLIFIEIGKQAKNASTKAGEMVIEKVDPIGNQHIITVQLFLSTINRASTGKGLPRGAEQFSPMAGLVGSSRYAEVLGHELAHVERVLRDPEYLRLYIELDKELASYCSALNGRYSQGLDQEAQIHLQRIDSLVDKIEKPVVAAEAEIWRELAAGRGANAPVSSASR